MHIQENYAAEYRESDADSDAGQPLSYPEFSTAMDPGSAQAILAQDSARICLSSEYS